MSFQTPEGGWRSSSTDGSIGIWGISIYNSTKARGRPGPDYHAHCTILMRLYFGERKTESPLKKFRVQALACRFPTRNRKVNSELLKPLPRKTKTITESTEMTPNRELFRVASCEFGSFLSMSVSPKIVLRRIRGNKRICVDRVALECQRSALPGENNRSCPKHWCKTVVRKGPQTRCQKKTRIEYSQFLMLLSHNSDWVRFLSKSFNKEKWKESYARRRPFRT